MLVTLENSDLSDCDSYKPSYQPISENFNEAQFLINQWDTLSSRAGVSWKRISDKVNRGRSAGKNIFSQRSGPTSYSHKGVQSKSPLSSFRLFIDEPMLCSIQKYAIKHAQPDDKNFSIGKISLRIRKIYWSSNSTWCFDRKNHSNSLIIE